MATFWSLWGLRKCFCYQLFRDILFQIWFFVINVLVSTPQVSLPCKIRLNNLDLYPTFIRQMSCKKVEETLDKVCKWFRHDPTFFWEIKRKVVRKSRLMTFWSNSNFKCTLNIADVLQTAIRDTVKTILLEQVSPYMPQKRWWSLSVPFVPHLQKWCLGCTGPILSGVKTKKKTQTSRLGLCH